MTALAIELVLHPARSAPRAWPRSGRGMSGRRHHAGAQLAHDLFANRRVVAEVREIQLILVQDQPAGLQPRVVAGDAVLIDERALRAGVRRSGGRFGLAGES